MISRAVVVAALITSYCPGEELHVDLVGGKLVQSRLERGKVKANQRQTTIRDRLY